MPQADTIGCVLPRAGERAGSGFDVLDLGRRSYRPVLALQEDFVAERADGRRRDTLILVEHDPVYTLGRNADERNVLLGVDECARLGIDVVRVGRGGDVTYHGPGQLVGYPILALGGGGRRAVWYVGCLETVLERTLADFGVRGRTEREHRGVWVGDSKIAAIGVRVTRGVTMHGFALNVSADLSAYSGIVPCGIRDRGVTSLHLLAPGVTMAAVKERLIVHFEGVLYGERSNAG